MARVFLSYRRADGRYAVGWIAERLRQLDAITQLRTTFQDGELRCGDDFPAALAEEVESCDVLVAVIGPNWLGQRSGGSSRILDPADWVGREVRTALSMNKRILPVLVGGAEPLTRDDLPDDLAALPDLHSVPFNEEADLDIIVRDLKSHLDEIDRERARIGGLAKPIELAPYWPGKTAIALAVIALVAGGFAGLALATAFPGSDALAVSFQRHDTVWVVAVVVEFALWSGLSVIGHHFLWTHLVGLGLVRVRWRPVLVSYAFILLLAAWIVGGFSTSPPLAWGAARMWSLLVAFVVLMGPWILATLGAAWTTPAVGEHELGSRARIIGELDRVSKVAATVLGLAMLPLILMASGFTQALTSMDPPQEDRSAGLVLVITWGLFLSAVTIATMLWSRLQLRNMSTALSQDLKDITPEFRHHAEAHLVTQSFDHQRRWLFVWLLAPFGVALSAIVWV
ncbi:MAG TPA: toll/interleukin-1 receptor domain-containing protein [Acidimicrobiia bacterium]|nr:toll/interleukin-1 receptor domain-containing protein [Acidimicrobiia bacterium]